MKILSESGMVELASVSDDAVRDADKKILPVTGEICEKNWLANGVKTGIYHADEVRENGVAQYRYFWHLNDQNVLDVNCSLFVGPGRGDSWLWLMGADMIARRARARGIICTTNRAGLIEQCRRVGFKVLGVRLYREFEQCESKDNLTVATRNGG